MSLHRTAFVNNNPVNFYDPDGYLVAELAAAYNIYNVIKKQGLNIHTEVSNYNFETGKLEQATINFQLNLDGKIDVQLDVDYTWRQGSNHGGAMLDVDAFLALDENDQAAYMASLGYYEEMNGKPIADIYMDLGNEKGWIMSGRGSSEQQRLRFELEKKARVQAAEKKLKTEANQIYTKSLIRQMNQQKDRAFEWLKEFMKDDSSTLSLADLDQRFLACGNNQACIDYVINSQIDLSWQDVKDAGIFIVGLTDINDIGVVIFGKNVDGSDASGLDYFFVAAGALIPIASGGSIKLLYDSAGKVVGFIGDKATDLSKVTREEVENIVKKGDGVAKKLDTWGNPATLDDHFERHASDFGFETIGEYVEGANDFFKSADNPDILKKVDSDGVTRIYDPETNTFGAYNPDGTTKTFFKPDEGAAYFDRQRGDLITN